MAAEQGFAETSEEMVQQLQAGKYFGKSRSFVQPKTRAIKVRVKEKAIAQDKVIQVREDISDAAVKLKVEFDVDSARIRGSAAHLLNELGTALSDSRLAGKLICVRGHTDSDGEEQYNLHLSYDRANSVKEYLLAHFSLQPHQLTAVGYGESLPLAANNCSFNKQRNRRVEVALGCAAGVQ
jgi:outer membrane protein OmpA-like peptidoglycan-associated protein